MDTVLKGIVILIILVKTVHLEQCYNNEPACWYAPLIDEGYNKGFYPGIGSTEVVGSSTAIFGARDSYLLFSGEDGFYLFGGIGYDSSDSGKLLNDFWYFTYNSNNPQLKWISGSSVGDQKGVYQTEGEYSSSNEIGGRKDSTSFFTDDLKCVFGGHSMPEEGYDDDSNSIGDMFCFSIEEDQWKFVGGHTDVSDFSFNKEGIWPGQREGAAGWSVQKGSDNFFYLFGGQTFTFKVSIENYDISANIVLNDFWKYSVSDNSWERLPGTSKFQDYASFDGGITGNTFNTNNFPPSYVFSTTWVSGNSLFLFGGNYGSDTFGIGEYRNDFWEYNWADEMWRSLYYAETDNEDTVYSGNSQMPGARKDSLGWVYNQKLFLFGGSIKADELKPSNIFNDLFYYDLRKSKWLYYNTLSDLEGLIDPTEANGKGRYEYDSENNPNLYIYPSPRAGIKGTVSDGKLYLVGGENIDGYFQDVLYFMIEHKCYDIYVSDSSVCSGHGTCNEDGTCDCDDDSYLGEDCSIDTNDPNVETDNSESSLNSLLPIPIVLFSINAFFFPILIVVLILLCIFYGLILKKSHISEEVKIELKSEGEENMEGIQEERNEKSRETSSKKKRKHEIKKKNRKHKTKEGKKKEETEKAFTVARLSFV